MKRSPNGVHPTSTEDIFIVELLVVVDKDIYQKVANSSEKMHRYCKDIANMVNAVRFIPKKYIRHSS